jgi:hypothetical protein
MVMEEAIATTEDAEEVIEDVEGAVVRQEIYQKRAIPM